MAAISAQFFFFFPFLVSEKNENLIKKKKIRGNLRPLRSGFHWRLSPLSEKPGTLGKRSLSLGFSQIIF